MGSITFFLKEPRQEQPTPIIARVSMAGARIKIYTGFRVQASKWAQALEMVLTRDNLSGGVLNAALAAQRARLETYLIEALAAGRVPTSGQLRQVLEPVPAAAQHGTNATEPEPNPAELELAASESYEDSNTEPVVPNLFAAY